MKKISAVTLSAFYLLLTTGLYVCILHCTADYFLGTHEQQVKNHSEKRSEHENERSRSEKTSDHEKGEKDCGKDANCSCCNQHGQYAVKENVPAWPKIYTTASITAIENEYISTGLVSFHEAGSITWPKGNAPPFVLKEPLYISYRSLLI